MAASDPDSQPPAPRKKFAERYLTVSPCSNCGWKPTAGRIKIKMFTEPLTGAIRAGGFQCPDCGSAVAVLADAA